MWSLFRVVALRELAELWDEVEPILRKRLVKILIALAGLAAAGGAGGMVVAINLHTPVARDLVPTTEIIATSGVEGFSVALFCYDPLTEIKPIPAPDANGVLYQLTRLRDGRSETVTLVLASNDDVLFAKHYYDIIVGGHAEQRSEPAFLDQSGRDCLKAKGRTK